MPIITKKVQNNDIVYTIFILHSGPGPGPLPGTRSITLICILIIITFKEKIIFFFKFQKAFQLIANY